MRVRGCEESPARDLRHLFGPGSADSRSSRPGPSLLRVAARRDPAVAPLGPSGRTVRPAGSHPSARGPPYRRPRARRPGRTDHRSAVLAEQPDPDATGEQPAPEGAGTPASQPRTRLLLGLAAAVLALDVVTKVLVVATIGQGENVRLLGGA